MSATVKDSITIARDSHSHIAVRKMTSAVNSGQFGECVVVVARALITTQVPLEYCHCFIIFYSSDMLAA